MYKNWPEINKLAETNRFLMLAVATLDLESDDTITQAIVRALPNYFSDKEVQGPVPWSILIKQVELDAVASGSRPENKHMRYWGTIEEYHLPQHIFYLPYNELTERETSPEGYNYGATVLPDTIPDDSKIADLVEWNGKKFIVIESIGEPQSSITVVPAECIALDL